MVLKLLTHSFCPSIHLFFSVVHHPKTKYNHLLAICSFIALKFASSQSETGPTVLISGDTQVTDLVCLGYHDHFPEIPNRAILVRFGGTKTRLVSPWIFWLDHVSPKYETRLNQAAEAYQKRTIRYKYDDYGACLYSQSDEKKNLNV